MRAADLLLATTLLGLCAAVVWSHFDHPGEAVPRVEPIVLGEALDASLPLRDPEGGERLLADHLGPRATVLYSWKVDCPCIEVCEPRLAALHARWGRAEGVAWVAVDGEPEDGPEDVGRKREAVGAFYPVLLDPDQALLSKVGFDRAAQVAVLDGRGRLRYRGSIDDDYLHPVRSWLGEALEAVVRGDRPGVEETEPVYGCEFSRPPACVDPRAPGAPPPRAAGTGPGG